MAAHAISTVFDGDRSKSTTNRHQKRHGIQPRRGGFPPAADAGNLAVARLLEPLGMFWIHLALLRGLGTDIAFKLFRW